MILKCSKLGTTELSGRAPSAAVWAQAPGSVCLSVFNCNPMTVGAGYHLHCISLCQPVLPCRQSLLCWRWGSYQTSVEGNGERIVDRLKQQWTSLYLSLHTHTQRIYRLMTPVPTNVHPHLCLQLFVHSPQCSLNNLLVTVKQGVKRYLFIGTAGGGILSITVHGTASGPEWCILENT